MNKLKVGDWVVPKNYEDINLVQRIEEIEHTPLLADNQRIVCAIHKDTKTLIDCRVAFMDFEKKELEHYLISCGFPKDELIFKELLVNCNEQTN